MSGDSTSVSPGLTHSFGRFLVYPGAFPDIIVRYFVFWGGFMRRVIGKALLAILMAFGLIMGLTPIASASSWTGYNVSVYVDGKQRGQAWGSIQWIDAHHFSIPDYWVQDTSCDSHSVFSYIDVSGLWPGKNRWNENGCRSKVDFGRVYASDNEIIRYIGIVVCRNEFVDSCAQKNFTNPYVRPLPSPAR